jgi:putative flippase GtrA
MANKPNIVTSFFRYNLVAIIATMVDFGVFLFLSRILEVWYVSAAMAGAVSGGIVAFVFNRNWAFMGKDGKISMQALKYLLVWGGSITLNTLGLYLLVENTNISQVAAKIIVSVMVGYGFNFLMNRFYIFSK